MKVVSLSHLTLYFLKMPNYCFKLTLGLLEMHKEQCEMIICYVCEVSQQKDKTLACQEFMVPTLSLPFFFFFFFPLQHPGKALLASAMSVSTTHTLSSATSPQCPVPKPFISARQLLYNSSYKCSVEGYDPSRAPDRLISLWINTHTHTQIERERG